jgi:hypothetical protein
MIERPQYRAGCNSSGLQQDHLKQRFPRCGELALAILDHCVEQLAFDGGERRADGGDGAGSAVAVESEPGIASFDVVQDAVKFLLDRGTVRHARVVSCARAAGQQTSMSCVTTGNLVRIGT